MCRKLVNIAFSWVFNIGKGLKVAFKHQFERLVPFEGNNQLNIFFNFYVSVGLDARIHPNTNVAII